MKVFPSHPHIRNFKVIMNGEPLSFDIAHVATGLYNSDDNKYVFSKYYVDGKFLNWTRQQIEDTLAAWEYPPFRHRSRGMREIR